MKTWEQVGQECRAKMKRMAARFPSTCGQCKRVINIGDDIVQPYAPNGARGNQFAGCWYCQNCGDFFQRGVDCGYLAVCAPWVNQAARDEFEALPNVKAWLDESKARSTVPNLIG